MFKNILIVCHGNICRSPAAEGLLKNKLGGRVNINSAGLGAVVNSPAEKRIQKILLDNGCDISAHRAVQLDKGMLRESDLILVMEQAHVEAITEMAPECRGKTKFLSHWDGRKEVPDPYNKSDEVVNISLDLIYKSVNSWLKYLA